MLSTIVALSIFALVLLLTEILIPGGILGLIGFILLAIATYLTSSHYGGVMGASLFFGVMGLTVLAFILFFRSPASSLIVLKSTLENDPIVDLKDLVGRRGRSTTALKPAGKATFAWEGSERLLDVVADGNFIDPNCEVVIEKIEGNRVVVRALT